MKAVSDPLAQVQVQPRALTPEQREWLSDARSRVEPDQLASLLIDMVDIPSPTGLEASLARFVVEYLESTGITATYQEIDENQANAIGRIGGSGTGVDLLLYGHLDTHLSGLDQEDRPAANGPIPAMSRPKADRRGNTVYGLGAGNPKAFTACMITAAKAVREAQIPLRGNLVLGLAAGGMPAGAGPWAHRKNVGYGAGCSHMVQQGVRGDFAIIGKPGYAVAWEEVGLCCFRVRLAGIFGYAGTKHILEYRNPIVDGAHVILELEEWFERYALENTSGLVAPQAAVGAVDAGWRYKPTFVPAWCDLFLDVRVSPRTDPMEVQRQLESALQAITGRHPEIEAAVEMVVSIPGTRTDPKNWIIQSCMRAFEEVAGRSHQPILNTSGATDAAILRLWNIPTARFGMPSTVRDNLTATMAMDVDSADIANMATFVDCLLYAVVDTCTRSREDISGIADAQN